MLFLFSVHFYLRLWIFDVVFWVLHASGDEARIEAHRQRWRCTVQDANFFYGYALGFFLIKMCMMII